MVPVVVGAAFFGLVLSALSSENVHKQVVNEFELKSRAASASEIPILFRKERDLHTSCVAHLPELILSTGSVWGP